jgi:hypothetical protein
MQKFGFFLLLILPALSYANSVRLVNASILNQDGNTGYGLGYTGINNKFITTLSYSNLSGDQWRSSGFSAGLNYGFQSIDTGSVYFGLGVANVKVSSSVGTVGPNNLNLSIEASDHHGFARLGYTKLSGAGIDYDYSIISMDGETTYGAVWRGAINDSGLGWLFGISGNSDVDEIVSGGISLIF